MNKTNTIRLVKMLEQLQDLVEEIVEEETNSAYETGKEEAEERAAG